jgi:hypothetical protein
MMQTSLASPRMQFIHNATLQAFVCHPCPTTGCSIMSSMSDPALAPCERPLTDHERELVEWLIEHGTYGDKPTLHAQIPHLSVRERCTCGCPTVYFAFDGKPVPTKGERLVSDHLAIVDGMEVGIMLFETNGDLSSLEVYSCAGSDQPFGLPDTTSIRPLPS